MVIGAAVLLSCSAAFAQGPKVERIHIKPTDEVTMESIDGTRQKFTVREGPDGSIKIDAGNLVIDRDWELGQRSLKIGRQVFPPEEIKKTLSEVMPKLKKAVKEKKKSDIDKCVEELEKLKGGGEDIFKKLLEEKDENVREHLRHSLLRHVHYLKKALLKAIKDKESADVRLEAARLMGRHPDNDKRIVGYLIDALRSDPDARVRGAAGIALTAFQAKHKEVPAHIVAAFKKEKDEPAKLALMEALLKLKNCDALLYKELAKVLKSDPSAKVRKQTAEHMGKARPELAVKALLKALKDDKDEEVRAQAAASLKIASAKQAFKPLVKALKSDPGEKVQLAAGDTLLDLDRQKAALEIISVAKYKESTEMKKLLRKAVSAARGRKAVSLLMKILTDAKVDPEARCDALTSLEHQKKPKELLKTYRKLLKEEDNSLVLEKVIEGIKGCGEKGQPHLKEFALNKQKNPGVRAKAVNCVEDSEDNFDFFAGLIKEKDPGLKLAAAQKFIALKDARVIPTLEEALKAEKTEKGKEILKDMLDLAKLLRKKDK
jgi:HEAT repeat protein